MYTGPMCAFCDAAKRLFKRNNTSFKEIDIGNDLKIREEMIKKSNGRRTVPQIFIGDNHICLLYTSPSPRDVEESRMPSSA